MERVKVINSRLGLDASVLSSMPFSHRFIASRRLLDYYYYLYESLRFGVSSVRDVCLVCIRLRARSIY